MRAQLMTAGEWLSMPLWRSHWTYADWREYLAAGETEASLALIRQSSGLEWTHFTFKLFRFTVEIDSETVSLRTKVFF